MNFFRTFFGYMKWHYGKALFNIFPFWNNILLFLFNFFAFKKIFLTFFTPWKNILVEYKTGSTFEKDIFYIAKTLMTIYGVIIRLIVLILGIISCLAFIAILPLTIVAWISLPLIIGFLVLSGFVLLIFS